MKKHFFSVLWETRSNTGNREYTREFPTEAEAVRFAREKRNNHKTAHIEISEQETEDTPETLYIRIIRMYVKF